jgi:F0F1-type ATP synthase membrane subunit b/b'
MVLITNSWRMWLAGMVVSLVIFAVVFFAVIKPSQNTANQAIKSGLQQSQQALNQAQQQLKSSTVQSSGGTVQSSAATTTANKQLSKAAKLASCLQAAGTDTSKISSCQAQFVP